MIIMNLNIDIELVSISQLRGGRDDMLLSLFWTHKYATRGEWKSITDREEEGFHVDNNIWNKKIRSKRHYNYDWGNQIVRHSLNNKSLIADGNWK